MTTHEILIALSPFIAIFIPLFIGFVIVEVTEAHKPYAGNVDFDQSPMNGTHRMNKITPQNARMNIRSFIE